MGQVYRARDTRLDREVAVKVLPESFASDPERRARFEREAKAVAALNHPNIVSLFDTGAHPGPTGEPVRFVVMELLAGETVRERLAASAVMPVRKAVETAIQIARGLAAAHDKQLVHRDLKPENVFLTRDGHVKILDFGIAKGYFREPTEMGSAATETAAAGTDPGSVIGTAGYMAPEQVRAQTVDARTDLFALGAVLYETLSGRRAFGGETAAETMTAILREDPPELVTMRADTPPALDRIVRHCLEKSPGERFQTARDVAFALESLSGSGTAASARVDALPHTRRGWRAMAAAVAGLGLLSLGFFGARAWWATPPATEWTGAQLGGPTFAQGPRLSPNGHMLAFIGMVGMNTEVVVMTPESGDWAVRTGRRKAGYVTSLSWSSDGDAIYFGLDATVPMGVYRIPSVGGREELVLDNASAPVALRDGSLLVRRLDAAGQHRLYQYWADTARLKELPLIVPLFSSATRALPDGKSAVVFGQHTADGAAAAPHLYVVDLASGAITRLRSDQDEQGIRASLALTPDGDVIIPIVRGQMTRVVRLARDRRVPPVTLFTVTSGIGGLDVGRDGSIYTEVFESPLVVVELAASGGRADVLGTITGGPLCCGGAVVLPDGRFLVPGAPGGHPRLMIVEPTKEPRPFLTTTEESTPPVSMVGDSQIAFLVGPANNRQIAIAAAANGHINKRIDFRKGEVTSLAASTNGETLYVGAAGMIWAQPVAGGEPREFRKGASAALSPDGRRLLVQVVGSPKSRLFEVQLDGSAEREIKLSGPYDLTFDVLNSGSVGRNGQLLVPLSLPDNWYFRPGIVDLATGKMSLIPTDAFGDFHFLLWGPGEKTILAGSYPARTTLWRFQSATR
jgi:hypothetical protein